MSTDIKLTLISIVDVELKPVAAAVPESVLSWHRRWWRQLEKMWL
jgi:hypothetical protein